MTDLARGQRRSLPTRRAGYNQKIKISGTTFHLRTDEFEDGSLGGIRIDCQKAGSSMRAMICAVADAVSVGLKYGAPLEAYVEVFKDFGFLPSGPLQGDQRFPEAASILDYVVRELEATYLKDEENNGPRLADTSDAR